MPAIDDELLAEICGVTPEQFAQLPEHVKVFARELLACP